VSLLESRGNSPIGSLGYVASTSKHTPRGAFSYTVLYITSVIQTHMFTD